MAELRVGSVHVYTLAILMYSTYVRTHARSSAHTYTLNSVVVQVCTHLHGMEHVIEVHSADVPTSCY